MKTILTLSSIAALAAFVLFPHNLSLVSSVLFSASIFGIFVKDCSRTIRPLPVSADVVQFPRPARRAAFELAA